MADPAPKPVAPIKKTTTPVATKSKTTPTTSNMTKPAVTLTTGSAFSLPTNLKLVPKPKTKPHTNGTSSSTSTTAGDTEELPITTVTTTPTGQSLTNTKLHLNAPLPVAKKTTIPAKTKTPPVATTEKQTPAAEDDSVEMDTSTTYAAEDFDDTLKEGSISVTSNTTTPEEDLETVVPVAVEAEVDKVVKKATKGTKKGGFVLKSNKPRSKPRSRSTRAGVNFPVGRLQRQLKNTSSKYASRVRSEAAVFLAGVLDYLCVEVIDLAVRETKAADVKRLTPKHIHLALLNDAELRQLCAEWMILIPEGGTESTEKLLILAEKKKEELLKAERKDQRHAKALEKRKHAPQQQ